MPVAQTEDAARLVLTEAHLQTVQRALHQSEEEATIVGWAHTHPGFGVFCPISIKNSICVSFPNRGT